MLCYSFSEQPLRETLIILERLPRIYDYCFRPFHTISKMDSLLCILKESVDFLSLVNCFSSFDLDRFRQKSVQQGASLNAPPPPPTTSNTTSSSSSSSENIVAIFLDIIFKFGTFTNLKALFQQQINRGQLTQPSYNVKKNAPGVRLAIAGTSPWNMYLAYHPLQFYPLISFVVRGNSKDSFSDLSL